MALYRGTGGAGDSTTDATVTDVTAQAVAAANSATEAASSATSSATSATEAASSATTASGHATTAETHKNDAETAKTAAETAQAAAELALDNFDDIYLGAKASDPTVDNDGDALSTGDLYFNTTDNNLKVYTGSAWVIAAATAADFLTVSNNLSDLNSASTARTNLGLGTAATTASTDYATAAQGTTADSALQNLVEDTTPELGGNLTVNGYNIALGDDDVLSFGNDDDLTIFVDSSDNAVIRESGSSSLYIDASHLVLRSRAFEYYISCIADGAVNLFHNNFTRLSTTASGVSVTGTLTATDVTIGGSSVVTDADIDSTVQSYDADTLKADTADTLTAPFRGSVTAENDGSFDMSAGNNFTCTPTGAIDLTFTNETAGQVGMIYLSNSTNYTATADADVHISAADLTAISATGNYIISYYCPDGTNVYLSASAALTEGS